VLTQVLAIYETLCPGQAGTSVIFGRAAAYGGPFGGIHGLRKGDMIRVTTGMGVSTFTVVDVRRAGDPVPAAADSGAMLTLVTATGVPFLPSGVVRVDADLTGEAKAAVTPAVSACREASWHWGTDTSTLWVLAFLLQGLILASVGAVWSWRRWGRAQTWIVFFRCSHSSAISPPISSSACCQISCDYGSDRTHPKRPAT